jgi:hypothetical protein
LKIEKIWAKYFGKVENGHLKCPKTKRVDRLCKKGDAETIIEN